jgi:hypothetical protein
MKLIASILLALTLMLSGSVQAAEDHKKVEAKKTWTIHEKVSVTSPQKPPQTQLAGVKNTPSQLTNVTSQLPFVKVQLPQLTGTTSTPIKTLPKIKETNMADSYPQKDRPELRPSSGVPNPKKPQPQPTK